MESAKNLSVIFTGNTTGLSEAFAKVTAESDALKGNLEGVSASTESMGSKFAATGLKIGAAIGAVGVVVAGASMKMAADFQQQMTYIRTDAGDTTDNINQMSQSILHMTSQFDATTLAEGMYHIVSLGLRGADALNALNVAQEMASVGGANLEDTTNALGGAIVTGIKGVEDYSQAAGTLDAIVGAGNMRMQDLTAAIGTGALTVFKNAGLSLTDFGAALATLTDNGMHADEAATRLKMSINLMEAPSNKAAKAMEAIGLTSTQLGLDMQTQGLIPALTEVKQHLLDTYGTTAMGKEKIAQAISDMFGGGRSSAAIQTLLDQLDRVSTKEKQIGDQSGEFGAKVKEQMMTPMALAKTAINKVKSAMDELGMGLNNFTAAHAPAFINAVINIYDKVENYLRPKLDALGNTISTKLFPVLKTLGSEVLGPLAKMFGEVIVFAIGKAIAIINIFVGLVSTVLKVALDVGRAAFEKLEPSIIKIKDVLETKVAPAILAFITHMEKLWDSFKNSTFVTILGQYFTQVLVPAMSAVWAAIVQNLWPALEQLWKSLEKLWKAINPAFTDALKIVGGLLVGLFLAAIYVAISVINLLVQAFSFVISIVSDVIGWISNLISWFGNLVGIVWNTITTTISVFRNLIPAVSDVVGIVVGLFLGLGGLILRAVGNFGSLLWNAGKDLISGLVNGIESSVGAVASAVGHVGSAAVSSIKNLLGIHSPSVVFHEIGQNITQGMINGITYGSAGVTDAIARLGYETVYGPQVNPGSGSISTVGSTPKVSPIASTNFSSQNTSNGVTSGSGGNVTINVSVGNYAGSQGELQSLARQIYQALQREARSNGFRLPEIGVNPTG